MKYSFSEKDKEYRMFEDFNRLYQALYIPEPGQEYWDTVQSYIKAFLKKYKDIDFAQKMCMLLIDELDKKSKKDGAANETT